MTDVVLDTDPARLAQELPSKLLKRLRLCLDRPVIWADAAKKHRKLRELGLVHQGDDGTQLWAVISDLGREVEKLCPK